MTESNIEKVQKALGEPLALEFSDYVRKLRNNLFFISVIGITICLGELHLSSDSSFLGLKFDNLNSHLIHNLIFIINSYLLIHFIWCAYDSISSWWIRVTGTRLTFITAAKYADGDLDYPSDPRQSSLYHWWKEEALKIGGYSEKLIDIDHKISAWDRKVQNNSDMTNVCQSIDKVSSELKNLQKTIERSVKALESLRIPASLERFDKRFKLFLRSQNLRWLIVELGFPLFLGAYSLSLLIIKL